jgi:hypothetical protein
MKLYSVSGRRMNEYETLTQLYCGGNGGGLAEVVSRVLPQI